MTTEKWALPIFNEAGFTPKKTYPVARSAVERACCETCFYDFGLQLIIKNVPSFDNTYVCEVCDRTYQGVPGSA